MKVAHQYIEEHKLLLNKWLGNWNLEEYKTTVQNFNKMNEELDIKYVIQDISDLNFKDNFIDFIGELVNIRKQIVKKDYRVVYLTAKPKDVVFASLYSHELKTKNSYMYCSTVKKALHLLDVKISEEIIEEIFLVLKKQVLS